MKLSHTCHQSDAKRWHVGWVTGQIVAPAAKKIRERVMTSFSENFMKDFSLVYALHHIFHIDCPNEILDNPIFFIFDGFP